MVRPKVITCYAPTARTATPTAMAAVSNPGSVGLVVVIDVTAVTSTPSVVFTLQGYDAVSGKYWTILASAAITGTGTTVLRVFPGAPATANVSANDVIPAAWRVIATHGDSDSITYTVSAHALSH